MPNPLTLLNKQTGDLAFKLFTLKDTNQFDHVQRLNYYSMIWIKKGSGKAIVDFSEYKFSENSLFSFTPYQPFMFKSEEELEGVVLNFHPDFFCIHKHHHQVACNGVLFNDIYSAPFVSVDANSKYSFTLILSQLETELQNPSLAQYELLVSYLKIFLIKASRLKTEQNTDRLDSLDVQNSGPFILQNLKDQIETNFKNKHSAGEYAEILNISTKALAKITKAYFNKTLTDLISERIMIEAKRELYLTDKSIKEIAFELGYDDEHYFSRFFKNKADISPSIYRDTVGFAKAIG